VAEPHQRDVARGADATHVERGRDSARRHAHRRGIPPARAGALPPLQQAPSARVAAVLPARGHELCGHGVDNPVDRHDQPVAIPQAETPVGRWPVGVAPACPERAEAPQRARMALQQHPEAAHSGTLAVDQPEELSGGRGGLPEEPGAVAAAVPAIAVDAGTGAEMAAEALAVGVERGRVVGTERGAAVEAPVGVGQHAAPLEAVVLTPASAQPRRAKPPEHPSPVPEQSPP
jgi:hypothetical protein